MCAYLLLFFIFLFKRREKEKKEKKEIYKERKERREREKRKLSSLRKIPQFAGFLIILTKKKEGVKRECVIKAAEKWRNGPYPFKAHPPLYDYGSLHPLTLKSL